MLSQGSKNGKLTKTVKCCVKMIKIRHKLRMIKIFPKDFSLIRKIYYSTGTFLSRIRIFDKRKGKFQKDPIKIKKNLRKGDIILIGDLETAFSAFIDEPITHSLIYVGNNKVIHAIAEGVEKARLEDILKSSTTLIILRIPKNGFNRRKIVRKAIFYAKKQIGKPYNFKFENKHDRFFCSQLVNESYLYAGYITYLNSFKRPKNHKKVKRFMLKNSMKVLHPIDLINGRFELVYVSPNLKVDVNVKLLDKW